MLCSMSLILRFIPAGAGNSIVPTTGCRCPAVYPRWRGELIGAAAPPLRCRGLSPLARGTLTSCLISACKARFIPAGAGNSYFYLPERCDDPVYPRWRGELRRSFNCGLLLSGLSPLARGTHAYRDCIPVKKRFIPAGAGNSRRLT